MGTPTLYRSSCVTTRAGAGGVEWGEPGIINRV